MAAAPKDAAPPDDREDRQAAAGRPVGDSGISFGTHALVLLEMGYAPVPIRRGSKAPAARGWLTTPNGRASVQRWCRTHPTCGIGLRTGALVGIDIELLDPDRADEVEALVRARLGDTLIRIGRPPKRMLLYRTDAPFPKMSVGGVEVLGEGQQLVAFGVHPDTRQPYHWPQGDPLELPLAWLPPVDRETCARLLRDVAALLPADEGPARARVLPRQAGPDERGGTTAQLPVGPGARNQALWGHCMEQDRHCDDFDALLDVARTRNAAFVPPLGEEELVKTVRSAWDYTDRGENWFGQGRRVVTTHEEIDGLLRQHPDAFILLTLLRRHHWGREFVVANEMAEHMPGRGWSRRRLAAARQHLTDIAAITMVRPACRWRGPAVYRLKGGRF